MTAFVVDINVAIVANGGGTRADGHCRLDCVERLQRVVVQGVVAVDDTGFILEEYERHLCRAGMPDVGDAFFKHLVNHLHTGSQVHRVTVTLSDDDRRGFEELHENDFDRSDRKFLAVAVVANAVVLNATDSDWAEHEALMETLEVKVDQLCPQHALKGG